MNLDSLTMATKREKSCEDSEEGHRRAAIADENYGIRCYSDTDNQSWHSTNASNCASSASDDFRFSGASSHEIGGVPEACRNSCVSDCSLEVDLEVGVPEIKVNVEKVERDCRICHLSLESSAQESGISIELGCSCKDDLAAAHKQCAERWFKLKGNKTCEICGSTARNVIAAGEETEAVEHRNETGTGAAPPETRSFWQGHRLLNFLLACVVFAFIISWVFHFNVPG